MLGQVTVKRFKNINDMILNLDRINVLVGANNAGKSSVLQAIQFAVSVAQTTSYENTRWAGERLPTSISPSQLVYSPLRDVSALAPGGNLREQVEHAILISFEDVSNAQQVEVSVRRGRNKNIVTAIAGRQLGERLQMVEEPFSIYVPGLAGIPNEEQFRTSGVVRRAAAKGDANNVFRNVLWLLKQDDLAWNQFITDFQAIFPNMNLNVEFNPDNDEYISASILVGGESLPIDAAGTGVLQAVQILSYVNVYKPKMLILDEPDSHLHPNNQRLLAMLLVSLSRDRDFQIILTTHSRHLLEEFRGVAKIHWIRNGFVANEEEFDEVNVLMEIGALDKGDQLQYGNIKCVLLTEDSDIAPIRTLLESSGFNLKEVDIWSYKGCTNKDAALILAAFIRKHAAATTVLLHRDRDYLTEEVVREYCLELERASIKCFLTKGTDTESHYLCAEHINDLYPEITIERAQEIINQATEDAKEKSIEKFINTRTQIALQESRREGRFPNNGRIAREARELYNADPLRYRHGKKVLGPLKGLVQREIGVNMDIYRPTQYIKDESLVEIAEQIWSNERLQSV